MASNNVDTQALRRVATALNNYIEEVSDALSRMRAAASECEENMGGDVLSAQALTQLEESLRRIPAALKEAGDLRDALNKKARNIEDTKL